MKNIVIIPNSNKDKGYTVSAEVAKRLSELGAVVYIEEKYSTNLGGRAVPVASLPENADLIIVIGGDGSVIDASVYAVELEIPVLGVNLGNLGYLAEVEPTELSLLEKLFRGDYKIEKKMLLSVEIVENGEKTASERYAVNDVTLSHESYMGLAELSLTDSSGASVKYRADGLVLSTPVGSTAYSLSAGGPIVSHDIDAILATPICPHSFFNRSVIFKPSEVLCLDNTGMENLNVSVDGRFFAILPSGAKCCVSAAKKRFKMLTFSENNMFSTLFAKMKLFENI